MTRIPGDPPAPARRRPSASEATGPTPGSNDHPVPHRLRRRAVAGARSSGDGPKALFTAPTAISQPALSPDGTKLAFARLIDGFNNWDILLRNLTTGKTTTIADSPASDMYPSWSRREPDRLQQRTIGQRDADLHDDADGWNRHSDRLQRQAGDHARLVALVRHDRGGCPVRGPRRGSLGSAERAASRRSPAPRLDRVREGDNLRVLASPESS